MDDGNPLLHQSARQALVGRLDEGAVEMAGQHEIDAPRMEASDDPGRGWKGHVRLNVPRPEDVVMDHQDP